MAVTKRKVVTLQIVMTDREVQLLNLLSAKLGVSYSAILVECAKRAIENN